MHFLALLCKRLCKKYLGEALLPHKLFGLKLDVTLTIRYYGLAYNHGPGGHACLLVEEDVVSIKELVVDHVEDPRYFGQEGADKSCYGCWRSPDRLKQVHHKTFAAARSHRNRPQQLVARSLG